MIKGSKAAANDEDVVASTVFRGQNKLSPDKKKKNTANVFSSKTRRDKLSEYC